MEVIFENKGITKSEFEILYKLIEGEILNLTEVKNRTNRNHWDLKIEELTTLLNKIKLLKF